MFIESYEDLYVKFACLCKIVMIMSYFCKEYLGSVDFMGIVSGTFSEKVEAIFHSRKLLFDFNLVKHVEIYTMFS